MREPAIVVEQLCKTFSAKNSEVEALKNISFEVGKGEIFGIIGLSGAGKSTLIRCLNLLEKPDSGKIWVNGNSLMNLSPAGLRKERQKIGMIFQHFNLLEQRNVLDNICFSMEIAGVPKKERRKKAQELLKQIGLEDKAKAYPSQLSGGQKQRIAIARVLANNPDVLLCDEATSALDPQTTETILTLLKTINEKYGRPRGCNGQWTAKGKRRCCNGFFPSEERGNKAVVVDGRGRRGRRRRICGMKR